MKIDGSFLQDLVRDNTNRALVQAMTHVAHTLGKVVVAEHVEDAETASILRELGVEYGQGFLWGRSTPELGG